MRRVKEHWDLENDRGFSNRQQGSLEPLASAAMFDFQSMTAFFVD